MTKAIYGHFLTKSTIFIQITKLKKKKRSTCKKSYLYDNIDNKS